MYGTSHYRSDAARSRWKVTRSFIMNSASRSCALAAASSSASGISRRKITLTSTSIWAVPARSPAPTAPRYSVSIRAWAHTKPTPFSRHAGRSQPAPSAIERRARQQYSCRHHLTTPANDNTPPLAATTTTATSTAHDGSRTSHAAGHRRCSAWSLSDSCLRASLPALGRRHGVKIDRRLHYRTCSPGAINLPPPRLGRRSPVLSRRLNNRLGRWVSSSPPTYAWQLVIARASRGLITHASPVAS
jgi:hypothetical protein